VLFRSWLYAELGSVAAVAQATGKTEPWVEESLNAQPRVLMQHAGLPPFIVDYELRMLQGHVEPFRSAELHRSWINDCSGCYEECAAAFPWVQAMVRQRNQTTGAVSKTAIQSSRQDCTFPSLRTGVSRIDEALARARLQLKIEDPGAYLTCNWYPDGMCHIASHRHDFWSAILCFGASRIFLLDGQPIILGGGDFLVFGTQKHSVPCMPTTQAGRISVCIFWYPERRGPTGTVNLIASSEAVTLAQTGSGDMTSLVLQALSDAGLQGEVVSSHGRDEWKGDNANCRDDEDVWSDSSTELTAAIHRSLLER